MYKYIGIHRCTDTPVDRHRYTMIQTYKNKNKAKETQRYVYQTYRHRKRYIDRDIDARLKDGEEIHR